MAENQLIQKTYGRYIHATNVHRIMKLYKETGKINKIMPLNKWHALILAAQIAIFEPKTRGLTPNIS